MAEAIAIIPARGGSKRIPHKNSRPFLGKPIIAYAIEAARQSGLFAEVMVSTDDDVIAGIATRYGASVPFRRNPNTATDHATTAEVLVEVLKQYANMGHAYTYGCCLYPTAPFVTPTLLQQAHKQLITTNLDTVYPIQPFGFPVQRSVFFREGRVAWLMPEYALTRSQDLEPAYHDAGQFYFFRTNAFLQTQTLITDNAGGLVISELDAHDIDSETDWQLAELKYQLTHPADQHD